MNKTTIFSLLAIVICLFSVPAGAITVDVSTYEFTPPSPFGTLENLDHDYYYGWGVQWDIPEAEVIKSAFLEFSQINNWEEPENDVLHIWMMDSLPSLNWQLQNVPGFSRGYDNENPSDIFSTSGGTHLRDYKDENAYTVITRKKINRRWVDVEEWVNPTEDLSISLPVDALTNYLNNDSLVVFGFDPDCHYWNCGVKLIINTTPGGGGGGLVPEPATMMGSILGLSSLGGYLTRRKKTA